MPVATPTTEKVHPWPNRLSLRRFSGWTVGQTLLLDAARCCRLSCRFRPGREHRLFHRARPGSGHSRSRISASSKLLAVGPEFRPIATARFATFGSSSAAGGRDGRPVGPLGQSPGQGRRRVAELVAFCAQADRPAKLPDFAWLADSQTPALVVTTCGCTTPAGSLKTITTMKRFPGPTVSRPPTSSPPKRCSFIARSPTISWSRPTRPTPRWPIARAAGRTADPLSEARRPDAERSGRPGRRFARPHLPPHGRRSPPAAQGRTGKTVQGVENGVIESLDKLIKKARRPGQQAGPIGGGRRATAEQHADARQPDCRAQSARQGRPARHRRRRRLGQHERQGSRKGDAGNRPRISLPLSRSHRRILRQLATEPADENHDGNGK